MQSAARVLTVADLLAPGAPGQDRSVRLGVSICNDNYQPAALAALAAARPQLVLAPHCCMVAQPTVGFSAAESRGFRDMLLGAPRALSRLLGGAPVAHANWTGIWPAGERRPSLWAPMTAVQIGGAVFPGASRIAGGGLARDEELGEAPGFAVADVDVGAGDTGAAAPPLPSEAELLAATLPGHGALGTPRVLATMAPFHEGAGRLHYALRAARRAS